MKKIFRYLVLLASLSLHAAAWGDMADNGVECSVVMEKTRFDARETFPDFKLVFTNKGEKTVRLFDDFYPLKDDGPNIRIEIWKKAGGKRYGYRVGEDVVFFEESRVSGEAPSLQILPRRLDVLLEIRKKACRVA